MYITAIQKNEVTTMKEANKSQSSDLTHPNEKRKPFEAPKLRREAGLLRTTAERMFTFGIPSS
jgi:hypothetical protein